MADDPTFEGWTTPPAPLPPGYMEYPIGRKVETGSPAKGYVGTLTYGVEATDDTIKYARRHWPERKLKDFHIADREWRDRASGETYRVVRGNPLASLGHAGDSSVAECFVAASGLLWFLQRTAAPAQSSVVLGSVVGS
jgi:hypothetical protein